MVDEQLEVRKTETDFIIHSIQGRIQSILTLPIETLRLTIEAMEKLDTRDACTSSKIELDPITVLRRKEGERFAFYITYKTRMEQEVHIGFWDSMRLELLKQLKEVKDKGLIHNDS